MNKPTLFIAVLLSLFFIACSRSNNTKTKLEVSNSFVFGGDATSSISGGGLVVWGKSSDGPSFSRILNSGDSVTIDLTNGSWSFYAMAWEGEENLLGVAHCGQGHATLGGDSATVKLTLKPENCQSSIFRGGAQPEGENNLGQVKLELCDSISGISSVQEQCTDTLSSYRKSPRGHAMSYRFNVLEYDQARGGPPIATNKVIHSPCRSGIPTLPEGGTINQKSAQLPAGDGATSPFRMELQFFPGSNNCQEDNFGSRKVSLPHGLVGSSSQTLYFLDPSPIAEHKLYIKMGGEEICTGGSLTQDFAGGDGSIQSPKLICSVKQLHNLVSADMDKSYKLLKNLDLNPYSKGAKYPAGWNAPGWYSCLEIGGNMLPIGKADCTTGPPFTGYFDGGDKVIRGLRIRMEDSPYVGLFANVNSGTIRNLKLINPELAGKNYVGSVAGYLSGTIENIDISQPDIEARPEEEPFARAGGLVGSIVSANVNKIRINDAKVSGDEGSWVGGLAGHAYNTNNIQDILVTGEISSRGSSVGGLIGHANGNITSSRFEGMVTGSSLVGGLVGEGSKLLITGSYAHAAIFGWTSQNLDIGGLVGGYDSLALSGTHGINNSYFFGVIRDNCYDACFVGGIVGTTSNLNESSDFVNTFYPVTIDSSFSAGTAINLNAFYLADGVALETSLSGHNGDLPRLTSEAATHPCRQNGAMDSISAQILNQKGSTPNAPILICNYTQFEEMQLHPYKHYRLAHHVTLPEPITPLGSTFSGSLNGNKKSLIGFSIEGNGGGIHAWWSKVTGVIKDLNFYIPKIYSLEGSLALLAGTNQGSLENISVKELNLESTDDGTGFVLLNQGIIRNINWNGSMNFNNTGGAAIVLDNYGSIENVRLDGSMSCSGMGCPYMGGISSANFGSIKKSKINLRIYDHLTSNSNVSLVSVSNLSGGLIEDIEIDHSFISLSGTKAHAVATSNAGVIQRIAVINSDVSLRNQVSNPASYTAAVSMGVGVNTGAVSNLVYQNKAMWYYQNSGMVLSALPVDDKCEVSLGGMALPPDWEGWVNGHPGSFVLQLADSNINYDVETVTQSTDTIFTVHSSGCAGINVNEYFDLAYTPNSGFGQEVDFMEWSNFSNWPVWIVNMDNPSEASRAVAIHLAKITGQPLPETPPVWEWSSNYGLELFRMDDY